LLVLAVTLAVLAPTLASLAPAFATAPPVTLPFDSSTTTTTVLVASGGPAPQAPGPRIGPFRGTTTESGVRAAWWLLVIGGAQVLALLVITRRSRARLPLDDDAP
jgi:hypothetical protein